jgi:hypothetical protein
VGARRLVLHPDAADEYVEAARWYGERSAMVRASFVSEVKRAFRLIVAFPNRWPRFSTGTGTGTRSLKSIQLQQSRRQGDCDEARTRRDPEKDWSRNP